jgi:hypothetical protein
VITGRASSDLSYEIRTKPAFLLLCACLVEAADSKRSLAPLIRVGRVPLTSRLVIIARIDLPVGIGNRLICRRSPMVGGDVLSSKRRCLKSEHRRTQRNCRDNFVSHIDTP